MSGGGQLEGIEGFLGDESQPSATERSCWVDHLWDYGKSSENCLESRYIDLALGTSARTGLYRVCEVLRLPG